MPLFCIVRGGDKDYVVAKDYGPAVKRWKERKLVDSGTTESATIDDIANPTSVTCVCEQPLFGELGTHEAKQLDARRHTAIDEAEDAWLIPPPAFNVSGTMTGRVSCEKPNLSNPGKSAEEPRESELWVPTGDGAGVEAAPRLVPELNCIVTPGQWRHIVGHIVEDSENHRWKVTDVHGHVVSIEYAGGSKTPPAATGSTFDCVRVTELGRWLRYRGPADMPALHAGQQVPTHLWKHLVGHNVTSKPPGIQHFRVTHADDVSVGVDLVKEPATPSTTVRMPVDVASANYLYYEPKKIPQFPTTLAGWIEKVQCVMQYKAIPPGVRNRYRIYGATVDYLILKSNAYIDPVEVPYAQVAASYEFIVESSVQVNDDQ